MKYVYLDNASGTSTPPIRHTTPSSTLPNGREPLNGLNEFTSPLVYGANPSSIHAEGVKAQKLLSQSRVAIAKVLNCHDYEVYFMPNSTFSIATAFNILKKGSTDTIITSNIEHTAVLANAAKYNHIVLKVEENGILKRPSLLTSLQDLERGTTQPLTRTLVSIMYANNEIGTIQKVKEYGRIIDEYNRKHNLDANNRVLYHIDASQASNYLDLDVRKLRCDMLTLNSSKCYGPYGIALLYVKEDIRKFMTPLYEGGDQERGLYSGTENVAGAVGFAQALTYVQSIREEESLRLCALRDDFILKYTNEMWDRRSCQGAYATTPTPSPSPSFREGKHSDNTEFGSCSSCVCEERLVYGSTEVDERLPNNINIRIPGVPSDEAVIRLDQKGFAVSHRSACATAGRTRPEEGRRRTEMDVINKDGYVLRAIGATEVETNENIRISMGLYTTEEDMNRLLEAILEIYDKYSTHNNPDML